MATGAGKTFTACKFSYRLIKHAKAKEWRTTNHDKLESGGELLQHILEERKKNWQGRGKYNEPVAPDASSLPELPEGWTWTSVDSLISAVQPMEFQFNFHTLLRLPTGIWYSPGVKANVLFFDKKPAAKEPWTKGLWVYDYRTNVHCTLKTKLLQRSDLDDFVKYYHDRQVSERFHYFPYEDLIQRDKLNLDIVWLKDDSLEDIDSLPAPDIIASEIVVNLEAALEQFRMVSEELHK